MQPAHRGQPVSLNLRTYKVAIYETLTRMIGELELPPGSRLVETELAARFNLSKTPVRETGKRVSSRPPWGRPPRPRAAEPTPRRDLDAIGRLVERMKRRRRDHD